MLTFIMEERNVRLNIESRGLMAWQGFFVGVTRCCLSRASKTRTLKSDALNTSLAKLPLGSAKEELELTSGAKPLLRVPQELKKQL